VITGSGLGIQVRQAIRTILAGSLVATLTGLLMAGLLTLGVYAGVVLERKSELGLLLAMGLSRTGLSIWLAAEAALCALIGALFGILVGAVGLAVFARSFGYLLISRGIDFTAPTIPSLLFPAGISLLLCSLVAGLGALLPAWRLSGRELYQLIRDNRE
jgi:putative ABC transport system permease protein